MKEKLLNQNRGKMARINLDPVDQSPIIIRLVVGHIVKQESGRMQQAQCFIPQTSKIHFKNVHWPNPGC
jgi:hypothetical protein